MLNGLFIADRFSRGTLIAEVGFFIVGAYYVLAWRTLTKRAHNPLATPNPFPPERPPRSELRYLLWGVFLSVAFFMFAAAADAGSDWQNNCLMGLCAALFLAIFGVGFVSLFWLGHEFVSQLKKAGIRALLRSFPSAIFWLVVGLAITVVVTVMIAKIPPSAEALKRELSLTLIAIVFGCLWMARSRSALILRGILIALFSTIMIVGVGFGYLWIISQTTLLLVLFLSAIGVLNVVFYARWVRLTVLKKNLLESPALNDADPRFSLERIHDLAKSGRVIEAIRAYREMTGVGLKDAKDYIDRIEKD